MLPRDARPVTVSTVPPDTLSARSCDTCPAPTRIWPETDSTDTTPLAPDGTSICPLTVPRVSRPLDRVLRSEPLTVYSCASSARPPATTSPLTDLSCNRARST
ncbi:hypothetical protein XpopCFBP1817_05135 [Xanthomonas populi]|uniref:Uncharacterized protein n=1 Tax=Xanthomonas populi TaxID=53414 RepID=A0A2S7EWS0_9XANT|nr:hypothetical protein XpopCFBP1817_05135 [Xanthomonas populi]